MASLDNLLNPESTQERDFRSVSAPVPPQAPFRPSLPSSSRMQHVQNGTPSPPLVNTMAYERAAAESNYYTQTDIIMRPHEPHQDCPDTLACLPDTNGRPQHTLPVILRCAILGSPKKRLTIREIYAAMEKKYPYYKTAGPAWKVRYRLFLIVLPNSHPSGLAIFLPTSNPSDTICRSIGCSNVNHGLQPTLASVRTGP